MSSSDDDTFSNDGEVFDRLPETPTKRTVAGRAARSEVIDWWRKRFGISASVFDDYTFWEKGAGKIWAFHADVPSPADLEALGLTFLRTRQEHWKPTTSAAKRFGRAASRNVIKLDPEPAAAFARGEDRDHEWEGDWGYLIASHEIAGRQEPIGVGLYVYGELKSLVPKGNRESVPIKREDVSSD